MVDIDGAIGFVVAHGDQVERARLSWLRTGIAPPADVLARAELGQTAEGGWPAMWAADVASVDATCFRLAELDDLGALDRPAARKALRWLADRQRPDGTWEEDETLATVAPPWARPGDPEARLYLTASAGFWLCVSSEQPLPGEPDPNPYADAVSWATEAFRARLGEDGSWPSYLVAGWLGAGLLHRANMFYEAAQIQVILAERIPDMTPADVAWLAAALRRAGMSIEDWLLVAARKRLTETQRTDGGWPSDDGDRFDVHTTLTAIRALR
ncbi:MAG: squalene--hopene cyclase [Micromonosporaceae bacterium]|nr:squalene--hopene cyclase [Micromonosporaceae bacterium]